MAVKAEAGWLATAGGVKLKLGYGAVKAAIVDTKYSDMRIITTRNAGGH